MAMIYDAKLHGGSQHRPDIWLPPFQSDDVNVLLKAPRDRSRTPHMHGVLPATDLYFLLDGGRDITSGLTSFFRGKATNNQLPCHLRTVQPPEEILAGQWPHDT